MSKPKVKKPELELLSPQNWGKLFTGTSGARLKLNSPSVYTVKNAEGVELEITGENLKTTDFFGLDILSGGTITGFDIFKSGKRIAAGSDYDLKGSSFFNAVFDYLLSGAKAAVFDLFLNAGESISGSWKSIESGLSSFRLHKDITQIRLTSGEASVSTSTFAADKAILDKIVGGFHVYGTAAEVMKDLSALEKDVQHIDSVYVAKGKTGAVRVSTAIFSTEEAALDKVIGGFSIRDTAAHLKGKLAALEADAKSIDSIALSAGEIAVSVATLKSDKAILNKFVGGFGVAATLEAVESDFSALAGEADHGHVASLHLFAKGTPTFQLTSSEAKAGAKLLKTIHGSYIVDVHVSTGTLTTAHGDHLDIHDVKGHDEIWANGSNDRFVFAYGFGEASVSGVDSHLSGKTHDIFVAPKSEFANFAALLKDAHQSGHAVVIDGKHGDKLTLDNVTLAELRHAKSDFAFV